MDCPSCAKKIENAVTALPGVDSARVLFATEKLVVDAQSDISLRIQDAVAQAGFTLLGAQTAKDAVPKASRFGEFAPLLLLTTLMVVSWVLDRINPELGRIAFIATTLVGLAPVAAKALRLIRSGTPFAIETLMSVAAIGALFIGATAEAAMVLLLFMVGELLESYAANRARRGVKALMELVPEDALLLQGTERKRVPVASLRPGDWFGELALLDGSPRSATAAALEPTETLSLPREVFLRLIREDHRLVQALLTGLAAELRRLTRHVEELHFLDLAGRLAIRLVRLAREESPGAEGRVELDWPFTQSDMASMIGGTRQSVNKLLSGLLDDGLVSIDRDTLVIHDLRRLEQRGTT